MVLEQGRPLQKEKITNLEELYKLVKTKEDLSDEDEEDLESD
jgi:hypothetical protein